MALMGCCIDWLLGAGRFLGFDRAMAYVFEFHILSARWILWLQTNVV